MHDVGIQNLPWDCFKVEVFVLFLFFIKCRVTGMQFPGVIRLKQVTDKLANDSQITMTF